MSVSPAMNRTEFLRQVGGAFLCAGFVGAAAPSASAQTVEEFYKGRTVTLIITDDNDHVRGNLREFFAQCLDRLLAARLFRLPNFITQMLFQFLPRSALFEVFVIIASPPELQCLVFLVPIGVEMPDVGGGAEHRAV